jgi:hypothetical protein
VKHKISLLIGIALVLSACKSNPNKAEKLDTNLESSEAVSGSRKVGLKDGEMVVMDKVQMGERLRDLQNAVYSLEDQVYGTRKLGTQGLYGDLKNCLRKVSSRQLGGSGELIWSEPLDRVTDKEEEMKIGIDDKKNLIGVSEEYLKDRIARFQGYKMILQKRHDEFDSRLQECQGQISEKQFDNAAASKVTVSEVSKAQVNKIEVNNYMCEFVRPGASLQALLLNAFAKGWLSLSDFNMNQNITVVGMKDSKGKSLDNGFMINGWKLAFDRGPITIGNVLSDGKDALLVAWSYQPKSTVKNAAACLKFDEGAWNQ